MTLAPQPTPQELRNTRADILMSAGSYAAVDALAHAAHSHVQRALRDADKEMADYWTAVEDILTEARNKIAGLPL